MLITTIQLSLVCPTVLCKYDLRKYVNTFKARSLTSVNKYNPACGMCYVFIQIATDMAKNILLVRTYDEPLHLFKVHWNDCLVSYFSLMYRYEVNTNILHLLKFLTNKK